MFASRVRDELARIQEALRSIEQDLERPASRNVGYIPVSHEVVEAWDAVGRAMEGLDAIQSDLT